MEPLKAIVIMDYQNVHLTARDLFTPPGTRAGSCLVHPLLYAEEVLRVRQERLRVKAMYAPGSPPVPPTELLRVEVHRGAPTNRHQPELYAASQAQRSEWTRDRRVQVEYRTLTYRQDHGTWKAQEKGIDVRVALSYVQAVATAAADVVILASHDTDLEPSLEMALRWNEGGVSAETVGWERGRVLRGHGPGIRHTTLSGADFVRTRDRRQYFAN